VYQVFSSKKRSFVLLAGALPFKLAAMSLSELKIFHAKDLTTT